MVLLLTVWHVSTEFPGGENRDSVMGTSSAVQAMSFVSVWVSHSMSHIWFWHLHLSVPVSTQYKITGYLELYGMTQGFTLHKMPVRNKAITHRQIHKRVLLQLKPHLMLLWADSLLWELLRILSKSTVLRCCCLSLDTQSVHFRYMF